MITVLVPTFNELQNGNKLPEILNLFDEITDIEVICIDSNSTDGTKELINKHNLKLIQTDTTSRAKRFNLGILEAKGSMILLHHPRSVLTKAGLDYLSSKQDELTWGAFTHKFDLNHPILAFTSWYSNTIRPLRGIYYLDHCIFCQKELLLEVGMLPEVDIFEDSDLSKRLSLKSKPKRLPYISQTSAIRFKKNGIIYQCILNQVLKLKYYLRINHKKMNKSYETGLELNSTYDKDK